MKERKQKISQDSCLQIARAEPEWYAGAQTSIWITENNLTNADKPNIGLMEQILTPLNLNRAFKQVLSNKGSGGIDKMEIESLKDYLVTNKDKLLISVLEGKYQPNPVLRVEIPKDDGKKRMLGIPTVVDRVVQQAIMQVLSPIYEHQFSAFSYGFRPRRGAHQELLQCKEYISDGYKYAVDMDLEKFFDTVNHSKLIEVLSRTIKDGRVTSLIHKYLNAGVVVSNRFEDTSLGVAQGGPLSPLLSNIMLNELDKELEQRGHRFVRYADDMVSDSGSKQVKLILLERLVPTLLMWGAGNLLLFFVGLFGGLYLSRKYGSILDKIVIAMAPTSSAPAWFYGLFLILIFISTIGLSVFNRRTFFLIYSQEDYVEMAKAKGLPDRLIERRYILKPTLPVILTDFLLTVIYLWTGAVILETVFNWPGLGRALYQAIGNFDTPVIVGAQVFFAYLLAAPFFVLDFMYALVDPRVRIGEQGKKA